VSFLAGTSDREAGRTYPGMAIWLLVLGSLPALLRDRRSRFWIGLGVASLSVAGGALGGLGEVPTLRWPARVLLVWSLAASILGGVALSLPTTGFANPRRGPVAASFAIAMVIACLAIRHPEARNVALGAAASSRRSARRASRATRRRASSGSRGLAATAASACSWASSR
jgi:hypothetical protein